MPELVPPMQVAAGTGQPPTGPDWVAELAWTGYRCIAHVEPGRRTRLLSSGGVSMTAAYPELVPALERRSPPRGMILDATLVARGEEHAPRVARLQRRSARARPSERLVRAVPVDLQVADLLWLDGHSTTELPYRDRRALLEGLGFDAAPVWTTSPMPVSELPALLELARAKGVDAVHARHLGGRYKPGQRSPLWVRVPVPRVGQVLVGGWTPTDPRQPDRVATLLVGVPAGDGLRYVGRVGVTVEQRRQVAGLQALHRHGSPFDGPLPPDAARDAIWVTPRVTGLVDFTGTTADGRLRLPRWRGTVAVCEQPGVGWARHADPPAPREAAPVPARPAPVEPAPPAPEPATDPTPGTAVERRRLEQHFVYNSLNTIASLIRTDPARARELLVGFADLTRAGDRPGAATLGRELDTVRDYLALEQARFGARLQVELAVDPALHAVPVEPLRLLATVREAVQRDIEPRREGGQLTLTAEPAGAGCVVTVRGGAGEAVTLHLG